MSYSEVKSDFDDYQDDGADVVSSLEDYPVIDFEALGLNPSEPTEAKPGSEAKVCMLAARYAAGVPLWHDSDCVDHGPERVVED